MRSLLIPVSVLVLGACGATNVNQSNYDAVQEAYAAEHGDAHGAGHGDAGKGGDHAAAGAADAGHADAGAADAGHGDGAADAHADGAADAGPDLANGEKVYKQVCISCHGADGKGNNGMAANLAEDKTRLAKPTEELVKNIREGYQGSIGVMPPWGSIVDDKSAHDVVAWLRHEYPPE